MVKLTWIIPVLPVLGYFIIGLFGRLLRGRSAYVSIGATAVGFAMSVGIFFQSFFSRTGEDLLGRPFYFRWAVYGDNVIRLGWTVDPLTIMMLFVVTTVSLMVQIYSIGYMHGDKRYPRFFAFLSLFTAAMLGLVIANNIILMYISWELVGLTSYLLIGFWYEKPEAMRAAKKAFLVTRVGDVGFFLGLLILFLNTGTTELEGIFAAVPRLAGIPVKIGWIGIAISGILGLLAFGASTTLMKSGRFRLHVGALIGAVVMAIGALVIRVPAFSIPLAAVAALLLFWGAVGKSAQFPLHVWLPDAMEGPTPVSALIHAATMVAAGVYLVGRMYPLFHYDEHSAALVVVAYVGAFTALFAATMGIVMNDIKRVLAYSTVSQLGYMMMGLGVGGYTAGLFHLMTHAFFKANLFLGSGSVIHGTGTQDIQEMGGLARKMPQTYWTFVIATAALAGIFPLAGFWSKDEILLSAFHANRTVFYAGIIGAFMTAFYMTRLVVLTFLGQPRKKEVHAHESPRVMTWPLIVLAVLSVGAGWIGTPFKNWFGHHIAFGHGEHAAFSMGIALSGTLAAGLGILLEGLIWRPSGWMLDLTPYRPSLGWLHTLVQRKYYLDEIYDATVIRALMAVTQLAFTFDRWIIDGIVNAVGWLTMQLSAMQGWVDKWIVDGLVNLFGIGAKAGGRVLRYVQTGVSQQYALILVISILLLGGLYLMGKL